MTLSLDEKAEYIEFANEMVTERNNTKIAYQQALYSRFRMHVLRIALTLELIKTFPYGLNEEKTVSLETMNYAIEICRYFIVCGLKVESLSFTKTENKFDDMRQLAKVLLEKGLKQLEISKITGLSQPTRITSYNVCYTKLLRSTVLQIDCRP